MHWFLVAAAAAAAAALLWLLQAANGVGRPARTQTPAEDREAFRRWLDAPGVIDDLMGAVEVLVELMAHRTLGGPGFLTLRLPQPWEDGSVIVTAQYPNIREAMYRRVVRRELDRDGLLAAGTPEALLELSPQFETDSGGMVAVSVEAAVMEPMLVRRISGRADRQAAMDLLAGALGRRFPAMEVRPFGSELLLTPVRT